MSKFNIYYNGKIKTIETDASILKVISSLEEELSLPKMETIKNKNGENDEVNITILCYGNKLVIKYDKPTPQDELTMFFNKLGIPVTPIEPHDPIPNDASFVGTLRPSKKIKLP